MVLTRLQELRKAAQGKVDQNEILISFPKQNKSIYEYKKFLTSLKKIGFTKIRIMASKEEFETAVYQKLGLRKYSKKQIENWESSKHQCNRYWLTIQDNELQFNDRKKITVFHDSAITEHDKNKNPPQF